MAYEKIYIIPDQASGKYKGGELWDRYDNFQYFVDVEGLAEKVSGGQVDKEITVKAHSRLPYINSKAETSIPQHQRYVAMGINQPKGARPGYTVTFVDSDEKRQFQYTGSMSALYVWAKANAAVDLTIYGPTGSPKDPIALVEAAAAKKVTLAA
jgi:hypothetical protein